MPISKADLRDTRFFDVVYSASLLSSCRRRKVGAAIFDMEANLVATGYNRETPFPDGTERSCLEGDCPRGMAPYKTIPADSPYSDCIAQHAEMMALENAKLLPATDGPVDLMMVVTHKPCHECMPVLEALGMDVFYLEEL